MKNPKRLYKATAEQIVQPREMKDPPEDIKTPPTAKETSDFIHSTITDYKLDNMTPITHPGHPDYHNTTPEHIDAASKEYNDRMNMGPDQVNEAIELGEMREEAHELAFYAAGHPNASPEQRAQAIKVGNAGVLSNPNLTSEELNSILVHNINQDITSKDFTTPQVKNEINTSKEVALEHPGMTEQHLTNYVNYLTSDNNAMDDASYSSKAMVTKHKLLNEDHINTIIDHSIKTKQEANIIAFSDSATGLEGARLRSDLSEKMLKETIVNNTLSEPSIDKILSVKKQDRLVLATTLDNKGLTTKNLENFINTSINDREVTSDRADVAMNIVSSDKFTPEVALDAINNIGNSDIDDEGSHSFFSRTFMNKMAKDPKTNTEEINTKIYETAEDPNSKVAVLNSERNTPKDIRIKALTDESEDVTYATIMHSPKGTFDVENTKDFFNTKPKGEYQRVGFSRDMRNLLNNVPEAFDSDNIHKLINCTLENQRTFSGEEEQKMIAHPEFNNSHVTAIMSSPATNVRRDFISALGVNSKGDELLTEGVVSNALNDVSTEVVQTMLGAKINISEKTINDFANDAALRISSLGPDEDIQTKQTNLTNVITDRIGSQAHLKESSAKTLLESAGSTEGGKLFKFNKRSLEAKLIENPFISNDFKESEIGLSSHIHAQATNSSISSDSYRKIIDGAIGDGGAANQFVLFIESTRMRTKQGEEAQDLAANSPELRSKLPEHLQEGYEDVMTRDNIDYTLNKMDDVDKAHAYQAITRASRGESNEAISSYTEKAIDFINKDAKDATQGQLLDKKYVSIMWNVVYNEDTSPEFIDKQIQYFFDNGIFDKLVGTTKGRDVMSSLKMAIDRGISEKTIKRMMESENVVNEGSLMAKITDNRNTSPEILNSYLENNSEVEEVSYSGKSLAYSNLKSIIGAYGKEVTAKEFKKDHPKLWSMPETQAVFKRGKATVDTVEKIRDADDSIKYLTSEGSWASGSMQIHNHDAENNVDDYEIEEYIDQVISENAYESISNDIDNINQINKEYAEQAYKEDWEKINEEQPDLFDNEYKTPSDEKLEEYGYIEMERDDDAFNQKVVDYDEILRDDGNYTSELRDDYIEQYGGNGGQDQKVFRLDMHPDTYKKFSESEWKNIQSYIDTINESSRRYHPVNQDRRSMGWARVDTEDSDHWFIDEIQSDYGPANLKKLVHAEAIPEEEAVDIRKWIKKVYEPFKHHMLAHVMDEAHEQGVSRVSIHSAKSKDKHDPPPPGEHYSTRDKSYDDTTKHSGWDTVDYKQVPTAGSEDYGTVYSKRVIEKAIELGVTNTTQLKKIMKFTLEKARPYPILEVIIWEYL